MKRVRIEKPKRRVELWWLEVLPLDPRDPDVGRAKAINWARRSDGTGTRGSRDEARRGLAPGRDATEWFARALRDRGMPPSEVRAVLEADDHLIVRGTSSFTASGWGSVSRSRSGTSKLWSGCSWVERHLLPQNAHPAPHTEPRLAAQRR